MEVAKDHNLDQFILLVIFFPLDSGAYKKPLLQEDQFVLGSQLLGSTKGYWSTNLYFTTIDHRVWEVSFSVPMRFRFVLYIKRAKLSR